MNVFIIYKQFLDVYGTVERAEIVEVDCDETSAHKFAKLFNLQIPHHLKNRIGYNVVVSRVI